ncbi:MAG: hypothetical protein AAF802_32550, partial [Planctomycetota bacterium]
MSRTLLLLALSVLLIGPFASSDEAAKGMTPRDFLSIHHLNDPVLSPDGRYVIYQRSNTLWSKTEKVDRYRLMDLETGARLPVPEP